jgi:general secretion pathway protein G
MWSCAIRELSCARPKAPIGHGERGATLVELLVVLVIVSILAVVALPMAENGVRRSQETALRETLRETRTAIDRFHADWRAGKIGEDADGVSDNGYPTTLSVLVRGVDAAESGNPDLRYLRRFPENPVAGEDVRDADQWRLIGYAQDPLERVWNNEDVYDLRAVTSRKALDGSDLANW